MKTSTKKDKLTAQEIGCIKNDRRLGYTYSEIADRRGRSLNTVKHYCSKITPKEIKPAGRVIKPSAKLSSFEKYLAGGGDPHDVKALRVLIYHDTEVSCSGKVIHRRVDHWRANKLSGCCAQVQMLWGVYNAYRNKWLIEDGREKIRGGGWDGLAEQIDRLVVGKGEISPPWRDFFDSIKEITDDWLKAIENEDKTYAKDN
jgi:hypothetical protein